MARALLLLLLPRRAGGHVAAIAPSPRHDKLKPEVIGVNSLTSNQSCAVSKAPVFDSQG